MAYPNYPNLYPNGYYPQANINPNLQSNINSNSGGIIWVQGENGAKSYLVAPNTTVPLWDSERKTIYLKSADASGMPSIKYIDYTVRESGQTANEILPHSGYATADDIEGIYQELDDIKKKIDSMNSKRYSRKREVNDDEREYEQSHSASKSN